MSEAESRFIRVGRAEVSLAKITKIEFRFRPEGGGGEKPDEYYLQAGHIRINVLNREEELVLSNQEGYSLLQALLVIYGLEDIDINEIDTIYP